MPPGDFDDLVIVLASDLNGDPPFDALIQEFDCGDQDLNAFLAEEALPYQTHGLTFTYLVFDRELSAANLLGFYSLSSDSLKLEGVELAELGLPFDAPLSFFPAVKLTKLAVRQNFQSGGLGAHLIKIIIGSVFSTNAAVRLITVNAVNRPRTIAFYERQGFIACIRTVQKPRRGDPPEPATILMYKDIYL